MDEIIALDKKLLLYLNNFHTPWLDSVMYYVTQTYFWIPLYLLLLFIVLKDYKADSWIPLLGILVTIILADQITTSIMKPYFQRLRPSREPTLEGLVHLVRDYKGGLYGFASSHAANTFGTAIYFWLLLKKKSKWIVLLFVWAVVMTYTRIYLGVHYPGDILVGALVGVLSALAGFKLYTWLWNRFSKDRNLHAGAAQ
jgi:undecaprenyl-diphosphatase